TLMGKKLHLYFTALGHRSSDEWNALGLPPAANQDSRLATAILGLGADRQQSTRGTLFSRPPRTIMRLLNTFVQSMLGMLQ
ncbi:MAG: hypothetical protein ACKOBW_00765, partial [Planctomycetota bacterium]